MSAAVGQIETNKGTDWSSQIWGKKYHVQKNSFVHSSWDTLYIYAVFTKNVKQHNSIAYFPSLHFVVLN